MKHAGFLGVGPNPSQVRIKTWGIVLVGLACPLWLLYPRPKPSPTPTLAWPYRFSVGQPSDVLREIAFYRKRVTAHPNDAPSCALLAEAYLRQARLTYDASWFLQAEEAAQASLAHQPVDNHAALAALATVAEAGHDFRGALELLNQTGRPRAYLGLRVTCLLGLGRVAEAAHTAELMVQTEPTPASYTRLALVRVAQGKDRNAARAFEQALEREEAGDRLGAVFTRLMLGRFSFRRGRHALARELYLEALRILPIEPQALAHLAELEAYEGHLQQADAYYAQALEVFANPAWQFARARVLSALGQVAEARRLEAAAAGELQRQGKGKTFGHRRDLVRHLLEGGEPAAAREALNLMKRECQVRGDAETLDLLAWALLACGKPHDAIQVETQALGKGAREAWMLRRLAHIQEALGYSDRAQAAQHQADRVHPASSQIWLNF